MVNAMANYRNRHRQNALSTTSAQFGDLPITNVGMQKSLALLAMGLEDSEQMTTSQANLLLEETQKHIQQLQT